MVLILTPIRIEQDGEQTHLQKFPNFPWIHLLICGFGNAACCIVFLRLLGPGQNSWTESSSKVMLNQCTNRTFAQSEKRQKEDDAAIDYVDMQVVEDDFVAARQADRSLGSQDFSRWLTMGRLMSLSFGETSLSLEHWQMVKELERLRRERLQ